MEKKQCAPARGSAKYLIGMLFIILGVLLLARNVGWLNHHTFRIIVSWQMAIVVAGVYSLLTLHYLRGFLFLIIGSCFLLSKLALPWFPISGAVLWPVALISIGVIALLRPRGKGSRRCHAKSEFGGNSHKQCNSADGFFRSENLFSGVRQVVFDEVFKGAMLRNTFGGTVIDLRHTQLAEGETYIDIDCTFGGIEIFVPLDWKVDIRCNALFGGCEDKRFGTLAPDRSRVLVIRGDLSFGGVDIKS